MENKKISQERYFVGFDIGTDSVGYAVTDSDYSLCRFKGEPMWGVNLFDSASQCADRRSHRTARRRYDRRQMRVDLLQELLCGEMEKTDPYFFRQINESYLWKCDKSQETLRGCDWMNREYNRRFPTVHHLIVELMNSAEGVDLRYLYLALAWLIAHRGHFLSNIDGESIEELTDIRQLYYGFEQWFDDNGYDRPWNCDPDSLKEILSQKCGVRAKESKLRELFSYCKTSVGENACPISVEYMIKLFAGGKADLKKLFIGDDGLCTEGSICLGEPDKLEELLPELGDYAEIITLMQRIYDCASLSGMLDGKKHISDVKVAQYETHKNDLKELKYLIRKYCPAEYGNMFRNAAAGGYSAYVSNFKSDINCKSSKKLKSVDRDAFYKYVKKTLDKIHPGSAEDDEKVKGILYRIELKTYMPKQVNTDNRLIPHQLYYAELKLILDNAEKVFPFLSERDADGLSVSDKIKSLFNFRIPYYVGPLNRSSSFAWIERKADGRILPWNFDKKVDHDASERAFIARMTNKCTYLPGEDVLPKCSLLYSEFTVLNLINNIAIDGIKISPELKQLLFDELIKKDKNVTFKKIVGFFVSNGIIRKDDEGRISGIDKDVKMSFRPYIEFSAFICSGKLTIDDIEDIILHSTCTEDRFRLAKWLDSWAAHNKKELSPEDKKYIVSRKFSDFGRLSGRLLNGIEGVHLNTGEAGTVIHFMRTTNDNFMQIISDRDKYNFADIISDAQKEYYSENSYTLNEKLDNMGISNAVKRPIIRTLDIFSDIVKAKNSPPEKIFIEMARGASPEQKNKRTKSRKDQIIELYDSLDGDDIVKLRHELDDLGEDANNRLQSEALFLYFTQLGKCMYCGKPIDISLLGSGEYDIDHIWPQAYIKDDSILNNKVLVHKSENGEKKDKYPLPSEWRRTMYGFWKRLHDGHLITDEKFKRLIRSTPFSDDEKQGFINRQLVETRQSTKAVTELLHEKYPQTEIVFVKGGNVSEFRHEYGEIKDRALSLHLTNDEKNSMRLIKSRDASDIHHAHDAYLNIVVGNLFHEKFTRGFFSISTEKYSLNFRTLFGSRLERDPSVWDPCRHLPIIDKVMANPHIHLTKYQTCQKGGFYDQNPLPAGSGELLPLKQGLDTEKYGGYNKPTVSFFVLVRYKCKKKYELTLAGVELIVADKYLRDPEFARTYIRTKLPDNAEDVSFPLGKRIIRINTVFSLDGFDVCLSGKTGDQILVRSMMTPFYSAECISYIKKIENISGKISKNSNYTPDEKYDGISAEKNMVLFDQLMKLINDGIYSKQPGGKLSVCTGGRATFEKLDIEKQLDCLKNIILYLKTNRAGTCDMESAGGKSHEGNLVISANISNWKKKYADVRIIDRTASGLFECRSDNILKLL